MTYFGEIMAFFFATITLKCNSKAMKRTPIRWLYCIKVGVFYHHIYKIERVKI